MIHLLVGCPTYLVNLSATKNIEVWLYGGGFGEVFETGGLVDVI